MREAPPRLAQGGSVAPPSASGEIAPATVPSSASLRRSYRLLRSGIDSRYQRAPTPAPMRRPAAIRCSRSTKFAEQPRRRRSPDERENDAGGAREGGRLQPESRANRPADRIYGKPGSSTKGQSEARRVPQKRRDVVCLTLDPTESDPLGWPPMGGVLVDVGLLRIRVLP
jgi:hypothetical protein